MPAPRPPPAEPAAPFFSLSVDPKGVTAPMYQLLMILFHLIYGGNPQ